MCACYLGQHALTQVKDVFAQHSVVHLTVDVHSKRRRKRPCLSTGLRKPGSLALAQDLPSESSWDTGEQRPLLPPANAAEVGLAGGQSQVELSIGTSLRQQLKVRRQRRR